MAITRLSPTAADTRRVPGSVALPAVFAGACWLYLVYMAWAMLHMEAPAAALFMPAMTHWRAGDLALVFLMWVLMMAAMMLPGVLPMVRSYARFAALENAAGALWRTGAFVAGYLAVWTAFSLAATLAQWGLLEARLVSPMMESASPLLSGLLLAAAGAFQFSPWKASCLTRCRSPAAFLFGEWRPGLRGAAVMGLRHGVWCLGCCALLMLLLFVLGVMNLVWIAALSLAVLGEKFSGALGEWPTRALGIVLMLWGALVLVQGLGLPLP